MTAQAIGGIMVALDAEKPKIGVSVSPDVRDAFDELVTACGVNKKEKWQVVIAALVALSRLPDAERRQLIEQVQIASYRQNERELFNVAGSPGATIGPASHAREHKRKPRGR